MKMLEGTDHMRRTFPFVTGSSTGCRSASLLSDTEESRPSSSVLMESAKKTYSRIIPLCLETRTDFVQRPAALTKYCNKRIKKVLKIVTVSTLTKVILSHLI